MIDKANHWHARRAWMVSLGFFLAACVSVVPPSASPRPTSREPATTSAGPEVIALAAGDIAACDSDGDEATAALLGELDGAILALGDLAYPSGRVEDFANCYDPSWGRYFDRTWPVPGNHEYETEGAAPYYEYFSDRVGDPEQGWYTFFLGSWRIIALNSNCEEVGGCDRGSDQLQWLRLTLPQPVVGGCTLIYWHHARWSSGVEHGSDPRMDLFWRMLADAGGDIVLSGHEHQYERFVPMDPEGSADPDGMVQFVVGTGGRSLYEFGDILPTSAAHENSSSGVLKLTLRLNAYDWEFVPTSDTGFTDAGTAACR